MIRHARAWALGLVAGVMLWRARRAVRRFAAPGGGAADKARARRLARRAGAIARDAARLIGAGAVAAAVLGAAASCAAPPPLEMTRSPADLPVTPSMPVPPAAVLAGIGQLAGSGRPFPALFSEA